MPFLRPAPRSIAVPMVAMVVGVFFTVVDSPITRSRDTHGDGGRLDPLRCRQLARRGLGYLRRPISVASFKIPSKSLQSLLLQVYE